MSIQRQESPAEANTPAKKKILHVIISLQRGGCEMALLRMLPELQNDFEHTFLTLKEEGPLAPLFREKGIAVHSLSQKHFLDLASYRRLRSFIQKKRPDLIFTYLFHADAIGRFFIQFTTPAPVVSSLVTTYNFSSYWPARIFEKYSRFFAKEYMANSEMVKKTYVQNFKVSEKKITVVPCGMDVEKFEKEKMSPELQKTLGIDSAHHVFICVANLHKNKGHHLLLEAFERLRNPQLKLLLVGEGEERARLLQQRENLEQKNNIVFLGKREDVPLLLKNSDTFVLPTFFEGMSNAMLEAMASRALIVTSDIPENKELITHNENGLLFSVGNTESLTAALRQSLALSQEERMALVNRAFSQTENRYGLARMIQEWKNYYFRLIEENAS